MHISEEEVGYLLQIQHIDLEILRTKKKLNELPQRKQILEIRKKKASVEEKHQQVLVMKKNLDEEFTKLSDEDERLALKQAEVQEKIDSVKGDYRSVESFTKELNGFAKRRVTLEKSMDELDGKSSQINTVLKQVEDALSQLEKQEQTLISIFQKEGGGLSNTVAALQSQRDSLAEQINKEALSEYQKIADRNSGIGITRLHGSQCSVCKNIISEGKVLQIKMEGLVSSCPNCKRLMVVE